MRLANEAGLCAARPGLKMIRVNKKLGQNQKGNAVILFDSSVVIEARDPGFRFPQSLSTTLESGVNFAPHWLQKLAAGGERTPQDGQVSRALSWR
jgi:hypothetical protein